MKNTSPSPRFFCIFRIHLVSHFDGVARSLRHALCPCRRYIPNVLLYLQAVDLVGSWFSRKNVARNFSRSNSTSNWRCGPQSFSDHHGSRSVIRTGDHRANLPLTFASIKPTVCNYRVLSLVGPRRRPWPILPLYAEWTGWAVTMRNIARLLGCCSAVWFRKSRNDRVKWNDRYRLDLAYARYPFGMLYLVNFCRPQNRLALLPLIPKKGSVLLDTNQRSNNDEIIR